EASTREAWAVVVSYKDVVDPPPTERPDADGDGVHDGIDVQDDTNPTEPPDWYSDLVGAFTHDQTFGRIDDQAGHQVYVQPDPGASPDPGRVLVTVDPTTESGG